MGVVAVPTVLLVAVVGIGVLTGGLLTAFETTSEELEPPPPPHAARVSAIAVVMAVFSAVLKNIGRIKAWVD